SPSNVTFRIELLAGCLTYSPLFTELAEYSCWDVSPLGHRKCLADAMEHRVRCLLQLCHFLHRRLELERFQCVIPDIVRGIQHFVTTLCCDCQTACYGVGLVAHLFS